LQKELRDVDVIGRSKEGQFVVLLPHADSNGAFYVADRLRLNLTQHYFCTTGNMSDSHINMNVGIAIFPLDATSSEGIVTASDEALSRAKGLGQNQTFIYSSKIEPTHRILIVDDDARNLRLLETILTSCQYEVVKADTGVEVLDQVYAAEPDLIILDVTMTKMDGFEVCRILKKDSSTRLIPVILNTVLNRVEEKVRAYEAGADDYLEKQVNRLELMARIRNLLKVRELHNALDSAENIIYSMADIVEAKDSYTEGHTDRVSRYASMLGKELGLSGTEIDHLKQGGVLHDIGKIGIPDAILKKPGRLTAAEFEVIRSHPALGYKICGNLKSLRNILPIIRHHHERLDGSGYPDGLKGDQIPLLARIMAICDVYDALTSNRPYRSAMSVEKALQILRDEAGRGYWDADLVEHFTELILQLSANS
jgi:putative two-component system response regulator